MASDRSEVESSQTGPYSAGAKGALPERPKNDADE